MGCGSGQEWPRQPLVLRDRSREPLQPLVRRLREMRAYCRAIRLTQVAGKLAELHHVLGGGLDERWLYTAASSSDEALQLDARVGERRRVLRPLRRGGWHPARHLGRPDEGHTPQQTSFFFRRI